MAGERRARRTTAALPLPPPVANRLQWLGRPNTNPTRWRPLWLHLRHSSRGPANWFALTRSAFGSDIPRPASVIWRTFGWWWSICGNTAIAALGGRPRSCTNASHRSSKRRPSQSASGALGALMGCPSDSQICQSMAATVRSFLAVTFRRWSSMSTSDSGGTLCMRKTFAPMVLPAPITVSPPTIVALA
jgi:hypothetical protein